jgi:dTDP-4-amino-4,6-dideoxygalactose transaminase
MAATQARVPFVDLRAHHAPLRAEIDAAMAAVVDRGDFILGESVRLFEEEFARYCGARYAVGVASGTSALEMLLRAHGIGPGHDVIVPASTFYATAYAVAAVGAKPVLADCELETANLDPIATEAAITPQTRAILAVHLYGRPAAMNELAEIARRRGLLLLEDACQAHGAWLGERRTGALGDGAAFSFYPGKNLGAFGDGGMVVTDDEQVAQHVRLLRDFGQSAKYQHAILGTNARLDTLQAAVLRVKLPRLDGWNGQREAAADRYRALLADLPVALPPAAPARGHVYHLYTLRHVERDRLREELTSAAIDTGLHYPAPIHLLEAFAYLGYEAGDFPQAERVSREVLSLPMFPEISEAQQQRVADALHAAFGR